MAKKKKDKKNATKIVGICILVAVVSSYIVGLLSILGQ